MSRQRAVRLAWACVGLCVAMLIATVVLVALGGDAVDVGGQSAGWTGTLGVVASLALMMAFAGAGALIVVRRPENVVGWLFCAAGIAMGLTTVTQAYGSYALFIRRGTVPGGEVMAWASSWTWVAILGLGLIYLPLLFPTGRPLSSRWHIFGWAAAVAMATLVAAIALMPGPLEEYPFTAIENPFGIPGADGLLTAMFGFSFAVLGVAMLAAVVSLVVRLRRSRGEERQQLKWFIAAGVIAASGMFLGLVLELRWSLSTWDIVVPAAFITIPLATGVAMLRYRLYDIDVAINRALVYGLLSAALGGVYIGGVLLLQRLLAPVTEGSDLAVAASTLAVAALFRPARNRIQREVDHRFYRRKYDAAQTVEAFSARLRQEVDLDALSADLLDVVRETMQPAQVSLWLRTPTSQSKAVRP